MRGILKVCILEYYLFKVDVLKPSYETLIVYNNIIFMIYLFLLANEHGLEPVIV